MSAGRLVEGAMQAGAMRMENGNTPPRASLNEAARSNMEGFLETLMMVLPAIQVDMFENKTLSGKPESVAPQDLGVPMHTAAAAMQLFHAGKTKYPNGDNWVVTRVIEDIVGAELHR